MTRVMAFGTFDQFHPGHLYFLQQARRHGDELVVVVARDQTVAAVKGHGPHQSEEQRISQLQLVDGVDRAVLGNRGDKYQVIRDFSPNVICLGYDQRAFIGDLPHHFPHIKIIRVPSFHPERYHSSTLRQASSAGTAPALSDRR
ncbi:MAG: adenylyltransferase/cytidyltransferase family protein [bacterium]|nr:adenylyltransferase/cytidyltransferase family protein [bacterium]